MCPSTCGSVKIANDTFTKVAGEESINVLTYLPLSSALHVPQFYFNLLSASSCVKFFPCHCVFQDLRMGQSIGAGNEKNVLYILESRSSESKALQLTVCK